MENQINTQINYRQAVLRALISSVATLIALPFITSRYFGTLRTFIIDPGYNNPSTSEVFHNLLLIIGIVVLITIVFIIYDKLRTGVKSYQYYIILLISSVIGSLILVGIHDSLSQSFIL